MGTVLQQLTRGKSLMLIIILGLGGSFHTGYHTTGLSSPTPFIKHFINSSWYDRYQESPPPQTVTMIWSLIVAMFAVGGLFGSISVRFVVGKLGRKKSVISNSFITIVAAGIMLTSKYAKSYEMIIVARIVYGFSTGLGQSIQFIYLAEMSPVKIRGIVTITSQLFQSLGKLTAQLLGLSEILGREELWNIILCVPAILSMVQIVVMPFLPEPPRYLFIEKGDDKACKKALQSLWGQGDYKDEMDEMLAEQAAIDAAPTKSLLQLLRDSTLRWQLMTVVIIAFCNQMSGLTAINVFSYDIFQSIGIPTDMIRYVTVGFGLVEFVTSLFSTLLIETAGRRLMTLGGYCVITISWVLVTVMLNLKDSSHWAPYIVLTLMVIVIIFYRVGPGAAAAAITIEIFIQSDRMAAIVLVGIERWVVIGVQGLFFPFLINALYSYCFVLFACTCLLGCLYNFFLLPETKGKTMLEISEEFKAIRLCRKSPVEENIVETKL